MVWLLAHCACPCGTDSGAICQPLTLIRLRQSIVSERLSAMEPCDEMQLFGEGFPSHRSKRHQRLMTRAEGVENGRLRGFGTLETNNTRFTRHT